MESVPARFLDAVVAIGVGDESGGRRWIGTGFLYARQGRQPKGGGGSASHAFLVSARHVLAKKRSIILRLNSSHDDTSADFEVPLHARNGRQQWVGHPDDSVDIGVVEINYTQLRKHKRHLYLLRPEEDFLARADLASRGVGEGHGLFVLGFPMAIVGDSRQYVICRSGAVARIRDTLGGAAEFLVDASVFPGNSGGPVILRSTSADAGDSPRVIGIVKSYLPYEDVAKSTQTRIERIRFQENSGLASAHPTDMIHETIEIAYRRSTRRQSARRVRDRRTKDQRTTDAATGEPAR